MATECQLDLSQVLQLAADTLRPDAKFPQHVSADEMAELLAIFDETAAMARRLEASVRELTQELIDEAALPDHQAMPVPDNVIHFPGLQR